MSEHTQHWVVGRHAVESALKQAKTDGCRLLISCKPEAAKVATQLARELNVGIEYVRPKQLDAMFPEQAHQGIALEVERARATCIRSLEDVLNAHRQNCLLLVLDGVVDPHNLGACLRVAAAAGAHGVLIPKNRSASLNATVRKVACGAAERIPLITVTNLVRALDVLQQAGVWIHGTDEHAHQSLYETQLVGPIAWVMGNEGQGMRRLTRQHCDLLVTIPTDAAQLSLNVSVAAGICLFETVRQRLAQANS